MTCPKEQALLKLFNNVSTSFQLLFLLLFSIAIFLVTFLTFTGRFPLIQRDQQYEYVYSDEDEEEEEDEETREEYSCVHCSDKEDRQRTHSSHSEEFISPRESFVEESEENECSNTLSTHNSPQVSDFENKDVEAFRKDFQSRDVVDSVQSYAQFENSPTSSMINLNLYKNDQVGLGIIKNKKVQETSLTRDERFFVYASKQLKSKKLIVDEEKDDVDDDESTCSSSECRSSIHYRDSQFQVLLQRYIENEPYEHGRRPEIYARMRLLAPKLLLVPEYHDSDEDQMDSDFHSKISSASFLKIMEGEGS
ncbi:hypothetical protein TSUD_72240 [Trifolium subterraneum]|uniref:Transmembrane protein n=1 Tax=Trifolium subterraneum TaxID=3900 RepID=A0A2Z6MP09_TRISU|nr:hypothetical protein TSUD_72240 [Trifolium subterraneum]